MGNYPFNVRVYGLLLQAKTKVLVVDENRNGARFTKFPGGGLRFGEGTIEALERECMEEMGQKIDIVRHFYTTDFFVPSAFEKTDQVISIYYLVEAVGPFCFEVQTQPFQFGDQTGSEQLAFRWRNIRDLQPGELTFPIDRKVLKMLKEVYV